MQDNTGSPEEESDEATPELKPSTPAMDSTANRRNWRDMEHPMG